MEVTQLRDSLIAVGITPADFSTLVRVTPRAVAMWLNGERSIPGPAVAFLDLLVFVPMEQRKAFIARQLAKEIKINNGLYKVFFGGTAGHGDGVLVIQNGLAFGTDSGGGQYDGTCDIDPETGLARLRMVCAMPAHQHSVLGPTFPYEWSIKVEALFNPEQEIGPMQVSTDLGNAEASFEFLRKLPVAS